MAEREEQSIRLGEVPLIEGTPSLEDYIVTTKKSGEVRRAPSSDLRKLYNDVNDRYIAQLRSDGEDREYRIGVLERNKILTHSYPFDLKGANDVILDHDDVFGMDDPVKVSDVLSMLVRMQGEECNVMQPRITFVFDAFEVIIRVSLSFSDDHLFDDRESYIITTTFKKSVPE